MMNPCRLCLTASALVMAMTTSTLGQDGADAAETPSPLWLVSCSNQASPEKLVCSMTQSLTVTGTGQRVLAVTVQTGGDAPSLLLSLPHGLRFRDGVGFALDDGEEARFEFTTSDSSGSFARVPLTDTRLAKMKAASILKLHVVGVGGRDVNVEVSLDGFAQTYELLK